MMKNRNDRALNAPAFAVLAACLLAACAEPDETTPPAADDTNQAPTAVASPSADEPPPGESAPEAAPAPPPEIVRATFPDSQGKRFFTEQVQPRLAENGCTLCHMPGAGYVRPEISYDGLFPFLAIGQAADNNVVMFKMTNQRSFAPDQPNHPGGPRCDTADAEPCRSIMAWWAVEFGGE